MPLLPFNFLPVRIGFTSITATLYHRNWQIRLLFHNLKEHHADMWQHNIV